MGGWAVGADTGAEGDCGDPETVDDGGDPVGLRTQLQIGRACSIDGRGSGGATGRTARSCDNDVIPQKLAVGERGVESPAK